MNVTFMRLDGVNVTFMRNRDSHRGRQPQR